MTRFIIFAPNVGVGGGLVLLRAILKAWPAEQPLIAILDQRGRSALDLEQADFPIHWVRSSVKGRWRAERLLAAHSRRGDTVFCFHNLPPILQVRGHVLCYVHNPNLVGLVPRSHLRGWVRIRFAIERLIAQLFGGKIERYIVQTPTMADALRRSRGAAVPIDTIPFVDSRRMPSRLGRGCHGPISRGDNGSDCEWDFIYVSDGATHKNHPTLFRAWELLAEQGCFPKLALTLHPQRDAALREQLARLTARTGAVIIDLGQMPHEELLQLYGKTRALLFASYAESFGIPLIEAQAAGVPILAAELDFVRDVCEPTVTFDPNSPRSIARAVRRFLDGSPSAIDLLTPDKFVARLLSYASGRHAPAD